MKQILNLAATAALLLPLGACYTVDHFTGDPARYDGLYFAREKDAPEEPLVHDDEWRNYAVWGLVEWDEKQTRFAGRRLAQVSDENRPMDIAVRSEQTFLNGLTSLGLGLLAGPFGALFFVPRSIEVNGWQSP